MTVHQKLLNFAKGTAYPFILNLPFYAKYSINISILIVGSTATGQCNDNSDVDICLLCEEHIFNDISTGTNWINGSPTEIIMNDIQLHYYAISYEAIEKKLAEYDDVAFYVYGNAVALSDNSGLYNKIKGLIFNDETRTNRKNKAIDMLVRRNRALKQILQRENDPILRIKVGLEIIELLLKTIALSDQIEFDTRKRFYITALDGDIGKNMACKVDSLINFLSDVGNIENKDKSCLFTQTVDDCIESIQREQGR